jgi:hypothetical protein
MARDQLPRVMSVPVRSGQGPASSPLQDVQIYRPGPYIALAILLLPALITLAGAAVYLNTGEQIPGWLPFILLLWVPGFPVLWLGMLSVRTNSAGIASGRPWSRWVEISWPDVERAEQRGPLVRVEGAQGGHISFAPQLLRDGTRLERLLLMRLPTYVLTGALARKARALVTSEIHSTADGGYSGTLTIHVRAGVRWFVALLALLALAGAAYLLFRASFADAATLGLALAIAGVAGCILLAWSLQRVRVTETGIALERALLPLVRRIDWSEVELIEHSPREGFLRFRGSRRLFCFGPGFLSPAQANLMRGFLAEYAGKRRIPMFTRRWLLPW